MAKVPAAHQGTISVADIIKDLSLLGLEEKEFKPILKQVLIEHHEEWNDEPDIHLYIVSKVLKQAEEGDKDNADA